MSLEEIQAQVFQLEPKERAELARQILLSLEPESIEDLRPLSTAPDPLQSHPEISQIRFHENPMTLLDSEDWPEDER